MVFEVIDHDKVIYQSDMIVTILVPDGNEKSIGIFNGETLPVVKAYPRLDEMTMV